MPDYGHALEFGAFVTPTNRPAHAPVQLAQIAERVGLDLVTFQDHPYQPAFLDTWTLMSWVAASTERIRISGNVLNLPLRQPAVLARSVASLDLLSGGRIELGLGAGGFWDPIVAMGGERRTAGEGVTALEEAIGIVRGIWQADERRPLRVDGRFHRVDGAKRGPRPAHDVSIWLGAYKPRMLRLTGRLADGWLPSLSYLQPGDLAVGNAMVDEAAVEAGRDPREIRRLLNVAGVFDGPAPAGQLSGPPSQWVEELTRLALEHGAGTFILASDDPTAMQRFAEEVAPAVREAVDAERASRGTTAGRVRGSAALAARRDGIDYDAVPASLAAAAIEPGDFRYASVRSTYLRGGAPGLVLPVRSVDEVVDALAFARTQPVPMSVRSGGHGISGRSTNDGGIVIDVGALDAIEVLDEATRRVRIGPGARWADVAAELERHGWALSSGDYGGVGVGGLATAGGVGWLVREHGLTIDHVRRVQLVTADGRVVHASATEHPELFWAVRGAGANFGIVTEFEFEVDEVGQVGWAQLAFDASDTAGFLERWGAAVQAAPRDVTAFLLTGGRRPGQPRIAQGMILVDADDPETIVARLQSFAQVGPVVDQRVELTTYATVMANVMPGEHAGRGEPVARSLLVREITPELAAATADFLDSGATHFFQIRALGGAVGDVAPDATAFAHRDAAFSFAAVGADDVLLEAQWATLRRHGSGLYTSFETGTTPDRVDDAFPAETLARLRRLKREWDPDAVFRDNFAIAPAPAEG